uniref:Uncharacterized protein n=1 Tax=Tanacetum cinerariifolium TaxID=118510 RepID=A0A6L2P580_TANCI|nr:hypothetical protein [Tanacetum cinerariifolium]
MDGLLANVKAYNEDNQPLSIIEKRLTMVYHHSELGQILKDAEGRGKFCKTIYYSLMVRAVISKGNPILDNERPPNNPLNFRKPLKREPDQKKEVEVSIVDLSKHSKEATSLRADKGQDDDSETRRNSHPDHATLSNGGLGLGRTEKEIAKILPNMSNLDIKWSNIFLDILTALVNDQVGPSIQAAHNKSANSGSDDGPLV